MIGESLGPYRILELLGVGGMGEVYVGEDTRLGRKVAIKVLPEEFAGDPERLGRFEQEARSAAALNHPNICTLYDVGEESGKHFIALELLQGNTLADRIAAGPCPPEEVLGLALQLAEGLAAAQERDVIHRDLKPANVFVTERGQAKILDFGLATQRPEVTADGATQATPDLTAAGSILGTMGYMSPEQALGRPVDARTDLFSIGVILYEMASGKHPFRRDSHPETLDSLLHDTPGPLQEVNPEIPSELDAVVARCLQKIADDRYPSATALLDDLQVLAGHSGAGSVRPPISSAVRTAIGEASRSSDSIGIGRPAARGTGGRRRIVAAAGVGAVALVVALVAWLLSGSGADESEPGTGAALLPAGPVELRPSVAVFEFDVGALDAEAAWMSPALAELIAADLRAGGQLRVATGDHVQLAAAELGIVGPETLDPALLSILRARLGVNAVVLGTVTATDESTEIQINVDVVEAASGRHAGELSPAGTVEDVAALAAVVAQQVRGALTAPPPSDEELGRARAGLPHRLGALRSYARGLAAARAYDYEAARNFFEQSLGDESDAPVVRLALADTLARLGYADDAIDSATGAGSDVLDEASRLAIDGTRHELAARFEEAAVSYRQLVALEPDDVEHWLKLIHALVESDQFDEANAAVGRAKSLPEPASSDVRLLIAGARAAEAGSEFNRALEQGRAAVQRADEQRSRLNTAWGLFYEGMALDRIGQPRAGARAIESAREIFEEVGSKTGAADAYSRSATIAFEAGDYAAARDQFLHVADIQREIGDRRGLASSLNNIAATYSSEGNLREQRPILAEALDIAHDIGATSQEGLLTMNLARLAFRQGEVAQARVTARAALDLCRSVDYPYGEYFTLQLMGALELGAGDIASAEEDLGDALSLARETGDRWAASMILATSGDVARIAGDLDRAQARHLEALEIREQIGSVVEAAESRVALAVIAADLGDPTAGIEDVVAAANTFAAGGIVHRETAARTVLAALYLEAGDLDQARSQAAAIEALLDQVQYFAVELEARTRVARVRAAGGELAAAAATLDDVIELARQRGLVVLELETRLYRAAIEPDGNENRAALAAIVSDAEARDLGLFVAKGTAAGGTEPR